MYLGRHVPFYWSHSVPLRMKPFTVCCSERYLALSLFVLIQQIQVFVPLESGISMTRPHRTLSVGVSNQGYLSSLNQNTLCFHLHLICKHFSLPLFIDPDFADLGWACSVSEVSWQVGGRTKVDRGLAPVFSVWFLIFQQPAALVSQQAGCGGGGGGGRPRKSRACKASWGLGSEPHLVTFTPSIHLEQSKP